MKTVTQLVISSIVFAVIVLAFTIASTYNVIFSLAIFISAFISFWFGRFVEKKNRKVALDSQSVRGER